jgi:hypothetical protein
LVGRDEEQKWRLERGNARPPALRCWVLLLILDVPNLLPCRTEGVVIEFGGPERAVCTSEKRSRNTELNITYGRPRPLHANRHNIMFVMATATPNTIAHPTPPHPTRLSITSGLQAETIEAARVIRLKKRGRNTSEATEHAGSLAPGHKCFSGLPCSPCTNRD